MSSVHPSKYGHPAGPSPHRLDAGLIQFCDALEDPAPTPAAASPEQLDQISDELFRREREFERARAAFEQQAAAQALRLADFRKRLIASCGQMIEIADRCLAGDNEELSDLKEVRERLEDML